MKTVNMNYIVYAMSNDSMRIAADRFCMTV